MTEHATTIKMCASATACPSIPISCFHLQEGCCTCARVPSFIPPGTVTVTPSCTMEVKISRSRSMSLSSSSSFRLRSPGLNYLRLRRIFDLFDKNGDGIVTVNEISQALSRLGLEADLEELEDMIRSYIKEDNTGTGLMFEDFVALHQSLGEACLGLGAEDEVLAECSNEEDGGRRMAMAEEQEESDLTEAFKVFDEDGDGYISANELQVVLDRLGFIEGKEMDRVEKMILSVDRNNDGRVDFFEFKDMMRSVIVPTS